MFLSQEDLYRLGGQKVNEGIPEFEVRKTSITVQEKDE
jgi:hypothetical protein